jgi:hypothetical protein
LEKHNFQGKRVTFDIPHQHAIVQPVSTPDVTTSLAGGFVIQKHPDSKSPQADAPLIHPEVNEAFIGSYGSWEEFMLLDNWRQKALDQLGVGHRPIAVDLFASPTMKAANMFITREMDAMTFRWSTLHTNSDSILWGNPPFHMLEKIVDKIQQGPCEVALCTPEWTDQNWWKTLQQLSNKAIQLPGHRRIYKGAYCKQPLRQNEWRTVVWLVDTKNLPQKSSTEEEIGGKTMADLEKAL